MYTFKLYNNEGQLISKREHLTAIEVDCLANYFIDNNLTAFSSYKIVKEI